MARYVKKPIIVEVEQWDGRSWEKYKRSPFIQRGEAFDSGPSVLEIRTLEGLMRVDIGDWIITGVKGEKYPCKPDIFEETYTLVEE